MLVAWRAEILDDDLFVLSISRTYFFATKGEHERRIHAESNNDDDNNDGN